MLGKREIEILVPSLHAREGKSGVYINIQNAQQHNMIYATPMLTISIVAITNSNKIYDGVNFHLIWLTEIVAFYINNNCAFLILLRVKSPAINTTSLEIL